jgi:membrane-associated phospholipid phosphatase
MELVIIQMLQSFQPDWLVLLFQGITQLGNPVFWLLLAAFLYWQGNEMKSFFLVNAIAFASVAVGLLKPLIARPRPEGVKLLVQDFYSNYSMPSGHATLIAAMFGHFQKLVKKNFLIILFVLMLLVAFSRVYLGAHYLSDVLVGLLLGYVIGFGNFKLKKRFKEYAFKLTRVQEEFIVVGLVILALIALALVAVLPLTATLLGYYIGFFLFRESGIKIKKLHGQKLMVKLVLGFLVLAGLLAAATLLELTETLVFVLYLVSGLWISFIYPAAFEKLAGK